MSTITSFDGASSTIPSVTIKEDSTLLKTISYVPIVGAFPSFFQEISLSNQRAQTVKDYRAANLAKFIKVLKSQDKVSHEVSKVLVPNQKTPPEEVSRFIELVNVQNQYKVSNVVRNLLTAPLIVTGIALGIFSGPFALAGAVLVLAHVREAERDIDGIRQDNQIVNYVKSSNLL